MKKNEELEETLRKLEKIEKLEDLTELEYTKEEIGKLKLNYSLASYTDSTLLGKIKANYRWLLDKEYTKEDIWKMTRNKLEIFSYSDENLEDTFTVMEGLGYSKKDIMKMTKASSSLFGLNISEKFEKIKSLGYTEEEVLKITRKQASLYNISYEKLERQLRDIQGLGYDNRGVVLDMARRQPSLFCMNMESIRGKFEGIQGLGYTKDEVIRMTAINPALYSCTIGNIREKVELYKRFNLGFIVTDDPKQLIQSVRLSYARYMYLTGGRGEKNISIDRSNYKKLFVRDKEFVQLYGIEKKVLLENYDYDEYMRVYGQTEYNRK